MPDGVGRRLLCAALPQVERRLVSCFADDPRPAVDAFHLYYVFALDGAHGFFVLRVPVAADKPEFTAPPMPSTPSTGRSGKCRTCLA